MTCHSCKIDAVKAGRARNGAQRFKCQQCRKRFTEAQERLFDGDSRLPEEKTLMILHCLLEGNSVRSTARLCDVEPRTVLNILTLAGERSERVMADKIRNVQVRDVECDEVWSFIGKKEKRVRPEDDQNLGDCYTFVAIERHSKLVLNIAIGKRDQSTTDIFVEGIRHATAHCKFQVSTDGFAPYRSAITTTLHDRLTGFAQLIKVYRTPQDAEKRYSPAEVQSVETVIVFGQPDPERVCTSIVERSNLSLRMGLRRFTRLTNGFSKKWENHASAVMLWFAFYNFCRVHKSLRVTPAMEAGITDHVWDLKELVSSL
jgi:transposase-like protein/IS1 family transposase